MNADRHRLWVGIVNSLERSFAIKTMHSNRPEPSFLAENQSIASLVSQLHRYFQDSHSHYQMERSRAIAAIEAAPEGSQKQGEFQAKLREIEEEITLLGVLSDALSVADRVLHDLAVERQLGIDSEFYRKHHSANSKVEQSS